MASQACTSLGLTAVGVSKDVSQQTGVNAGLHQEIKSQDQCKSDCEALLLILKSMGRVPLAVCCHGETGKPAKLIACVTK